MWDNLLQNLPVVIVLIVAGIICGADLIKSIRVWREERDNKINKEVQSKLDSMNFQKEFEALHNRFDEMESRLDVVDKQVKNLIASDLNDIKAWIIEQHNNFVNKIGWIDYYHLEAINRRYEDYHEEGGNGYIETLVQNIRNLPTEPPKKV